LQDIANDAVSKQKFPTLSRLWASLTGVFDTLNRAVRELVPFSTTYLCESLYLWYCMKETIERNYLDAEANLRWQVSPITTDFIMMCSSKTLHPSH
jgi:hypothetical protein